MDGTQLLVFLTAAHVMLFMAGDAGLVEDKSQSDHKDFAEKFAPGGEAESSLDANQEDGIINDIGVAFKSLPVIGFLIELITTPYNLLGNSGLPSNVVLLFQAILGVMETSVVAGFIRGVNF